MYGVVDGVDGATSSTWSTKSTPSTRPQNACAYPLLWNFRDLLAKSKPNMA